MADLIKYFEENKLVKYKDIKAKLETDLELKVKDSKTIPSLYIISYNKIESDFTKAATLNCRGIILEKETNKIVCYPFDTFFNSGEKLAKKIDWESAICEEKADGSFIKLYYYQGSWHFASNGCVKASEAKIPSSPTVTLQDLIEEVLGGPKGIKNLTNKLKTNFCYMFELVHPENQIVVPYKEGKLVLLGARNLDTLMEEPIDFPFDSNPGLRPVTSFKFDPIEPLDSIKKRLNDSKWCDEEGFVVRDASYNRIKIKAPDYLLHHHNMTSAKFSSKGHFDYAIDVLVKGEESEVIAYASDETQNGKYLIKIKEIIDDIKEGLNEIENRMIKYIRENTDSLDDLTDKKVRNKLMKQASRDINKKDFSCLIMIYDILASGKKDESFLSTIKRKGASHMLEELFKDKFATDPKEKVIESIEM